MSLEEIGKRLTEMNHSQIIVEAIQQKQRKLIPNSEKQNEQTSEHQTEKVIQKEEK